MILKPVKNIELFCEKAEPVIGVFGSKKWLSIYGDSIALIGIYKDEHQLIGGFYYVMTKKFGFSFLKLPPYTPHCGLFFISEGKNRASLNSFYKEVMGEVCSYLSSQKSALTILAFPYQITDFQQFIWNKYKVVPNYTYKIDLAASIDTITANFDPKNRNVISKALKEGVTVSIGKLSRPELYRFFIRSLEAAGANIYKKELEAVFLNFSDDTNSFSLSAEKNGTLLGVVFCIYDKNNCYYLLGGLDKSLAIPGINNLLILNAIERAKALGCGTFDFEGSMLKGVEKFFRSFGPELVPYYTVNKAKLPLEIALKFKKRELF